MRETLSGRRETVHSVVRVFVVAWLVVMLVAAPAVAQTETTTPEGETAPCATGPPVPGQGDETDDGGGGLEVALVTDKSGSMGIDGNMEPAKDAAIGLVNRLEPTKEAASVSFGDTADLDQELTTDHQAVKDAIESIESVDGVHEDMSDGIRTGYEALTTGENATEGVQKTMVFLTDDGDVDDEQDALSAAQDAKDDGVRIFSIGLGGGGVDEQFVENVASSPDDAYIAPNGSDLDSIYQEITGEVEAIGGDLEIDTRSLYQPGATHSYEVQEITYLEDNTTEREDVTENANVTTTNTTLLSVDESGHTLSATGDANTSTWVRVDATVNGTTGCTNVIVAEPTVGNLQLLPNGTWRFSAVMTDSFFQALLVALFVGVAAARFTSAFAGLAGSQMVLVMGWFAGYVPWVYAVLGLFVALFIGLNLAANIDYTVRR